MNPFLILGVPREADDATIRGAYLKGIKEATPEGNPARFKQLTEAYEQIRSEERRHRYTLFNLDSPGDSPLEAYRACLRVAGQHRPLPLNAMKDYLKSCLK